MSELVPDLGGLVSLRWRRRTREGTISAQGVTDLHTGAFKLEGSVVVVMAALLLMVVVVVVGVGVVVVVVVSGRVIGGSKVHVVRYM